MDGKAMAAQIREEIRHTVLTLQQPPGLAVILVGTRRDSQLYVNMKKKACAAAGMLSTGYDFDDTVSQDDLLAVVRHLNADPTIHGILVQLPLPVHICQDTILQAVHPDKDVDGLHPTNTAALQLYDNTNVSQAPFSIPCTPLGCLELLQRSDVPLRGAHCVVAGRSHLVGLPMARLLLQQDATVTIVHSQTVDIARVVRQADVLVAAVGKPELIKGDWIKEGAVVIDVGINSVEDAQAKKGYRLVGDVEYERAVKVCSKITPVPGGVGPMTIAMLLRNTLNACLRANEKNKVTTKE